LGEKGGKKPPKLGGNDEKEGVEAPDRGASRGVLMPLEALHKNFGSRKIAQQEQ
jgi:hypothetical protein